MDVYLCSQRDAWAPRRFFTKAIVDTQSEPTEVVTDRARAYLSVLDELLPAALHDVERYANNPSRPEVPAGTDAGLTMATAQLF